MRRYHRPIQHLPTHINAEEAEKKKYLFVDILNLPPRITEYHIELLFKPWADILSCSIHKKSLGYRRTATVSFADQERGCLAVHHMDGIKLDQELKLVPYFRINGKRKQVMIRVVDPKAQKGADSVEIETSDEKDIKKEEDESEDSEEEEKSSSVPGKEKKNHRLEDNKSLFGSLISDGKTGPTDDSFEMLPNTWKKGLLYRENSDIPTKYCVIANIAPPEASYVLLDKICSYLSEKIQEELKIDIKWDIVGVIDGICCVACECKNTKESYKLYKFLHQTEILKRVVLCGFII
ncbi:hypothetical protein ADUPG1_010430 [Aduncisulcus paluster]|uniref:RRM domain-containing protein n=1 Tax=Aduncisulcus paluster TaxID=2918883 RepID=A0ABQ5JVZ5_9EUKA|nr:hypothetical protein ADUPG1_010430 [Aduncisulcus paluster]